MQHIKSTNVHYIAQRTEQLGIIVRPLCCDVCDEPKPLVRHHRDYDKPTEITWVCHSCHGKEHRTGKASIILGERKPVQLDVKTHAIIQKESIRQSIKPGFSVTMGGVISQLAIQLTKKRRRK